MPVPARGAVVRGEDFCRVLLVEDDEDNRDMYTTALRSQGFAVVSTDNGLTAFEEAFRTRPDVVVTDLAIPGIDGFELCRRLRGADRTRTIPIITLTGRFTAPTDRQLLGPSDVDLYLVKPCDPQRLSAEIRRVVEQSRQLRVRSADAVLRAHAATARAESAQVRSREVSERWRQKITAADALRRIRADFEEMPGLRVTVEQGARLWNLDSIVCVHLLDELVKAGVLNKSGGRYYLG